MSVDVPVKLARMAGRLYRLYHATLRLSVRLPDCSIVRPDDYPYQRQIFVLCERDTLVYAAIAARRGFTMLVAPGRDGDWAAEALGAIGGRIVRGARLRGGSRALATLLRTLPNTDAPAGIVADGPIGPDGDLQAGAWYLALRTGRPIVGLFGVARRAMVFRKTWSRLFLPWPFTSVTLAVSVPTFVDDRRAIDPARQQLQAWIRQERPRDLGLRPFRLRLEDRLGRHR
jgi:lysophospholipid acyltransferase (LPLAT)-like uncharacterized protein